MILLGGIYNSDVKNQPTYAITSVDHALELATVLAEQGPMGVSEAAEYLGVAPSTAHRLLAMLVYRDFAEQDDDRRYRAGSMLQGANERSSVIRRLRTAAIAHLRGLAAATGETASLQTLVGSDVRFLESIEGERLLRVGSRKGWRLPAHRVSGGLVLLAELSSGDVRDRCQDVSDVEVTGLLRELAAVRKRGFAVNEERTEPGVSAVAVPVVGALGRAVAALALAMPTVRFDPDRIAGIIEVMRDAARRIQNESLSPTDWIDFRQAGVPHAQRASDEHAL